MSVYDDDDDDDWWEYDIVKVYLFLCLIKHHAKKMYEGVEVYLHTFLTLASHGYQWSALHLGYFTNRGRAICTHWIGWVCPRAQFN
jgi:hypothetical protein